MINCLKDGIFENVDFEIRKRKHLVMEEIRFISHLGS